MKISSKYLKKENVRKIRRLMKEQTEDDFFAINIVYFVSSLPISVNKKHFKTNPKFNKLFVQKFTKLFALYFILFI